jgi:AraC-like DNA-binding protein
MSEPLATWLANLRLRHAFLVVGRIGENVGVRIEPEGGAAFHHCLRGPCVVAVEGRPPVSLCDGDFLFMRDGLARVVWASEAPGSSRPVALRSLVPTVPRDAAVRFAVGEAARERLVIGGAFCIASAETRLLVDALPPLFCVRKGAPHTTRLDTIVEQLVDEATNATPGASPVVARLAEVAVLIGLRAFVSSDQQRHGLLEAARDPRLGRALAAIEREPQRDWTIAQLGRRAGMSRSAFAAAFAASVGETPAAYLTRVRMARAESLLRDRDWSLPRIAQEVGYASVAAFSVAFKRLRGMPPSALRKEGARPLVASAMLGK